MGGTASCCVWACAYVCEYVCVCYLDSAAEYQQQKSLQVLHALRCRNKTQRRSVYHNISKSLNTMCEETMMKG